jgi:hypothetical protein
MMKFLKLFIVILQFSRFATASADDLSATNVLKWPRLRADEFGCFLEKKFGFRNKKYNCDLKNYVASGDPCINTDAYYEGPLFPTDKAKEVNSLVEEIQLHWEHGELQSVILKFVRSVPEKELVKTFGLPSKFSYPEEYQNIMSIDIQKCSKVGNCLQLQGFERMGAGDVECPFE